MRRSISAIKGAVPRNPRPSCAVSAQALLLHALSVTHSTRVSGLFQTWPVLAETGYTQLVVPCGDFQLHGVTTRYLCYTGKSTGKFAFNRRIIPMSRMTRLKTITEFLDVPNISQDGVCRIYIYFTTHLRQHIVYRPLMRWNTKRNEVSHSSEKDPPIRS
jgi:hypothetical protein